MSFSIFWLVIVWLLAAFVILLQAVYIWRLDFGKILAMTIAQACHASRRGVLIASAALVTLSWPIWLEVNTFDRAVFRDGKLVRVIDSGAVMLQSTWNKTTSGSDVFTLMSGALSKGDIVEIQSSGEGGTNGVFIITIEGKNGRDDVLKRLEFISKAGIKTGLFDYVPSIVRRIFRESPHFDEMCRTAKNLSAEESGDGTSRLKAKREVLEIAEKTSKDLWSRFGIRIIDVDHR